MPVSPTTEGFRAAFRRPSFVLAELMWRWAVGATTFTLFFFGLFEYLNTLPVTSGELLFLRTRQPYLVVQAIAHILRGSLHRAVMSALLAALLLALLWMLAAGLGRIVTVRALLEYFRTVVAPMTVSGRSEQDVASHASTGAFVSLLRINFLRIVVALAVVLGFLGAAIVVSFASPDSDPQPGLAFLLFLPLAGIVALIGFVLNWLFSLASMFAVRDPVDAMGAISAAVSLCRERTGALFAVSAWTGIAHLALFMGATSVVAIPLSALGILPVRLILLCVFLMSLAYFAIVDWLYLARLAGYVCIAEMPEAMLAPAPPAPLPTTPPVFTTIDREELILSDVPNAVAEA